MKWNLRKSSYPRCHGQKTVIALKHSLIEPQCVAKTKCLEHPSFIELVRLPIRRPMNKVLAQTGSSLTVSNARDRSPNSSIKRLTWSLVAFVLSRLVAFAPLEWYLHPEMFLKNCEFEKCYQVLSVAMVLRQKRFCQITLLRTMCIHAEVWMMIARR